MKEREGSENQEPKKVDLDHLLPLVSRGFKKGESIEEGRERQAARRRAESTDEADLVLIKKDEADYLSLPLLAPENLRNKAYWIPRYHPITGAVFTSRWGKAKFETPNENQSKDATGKTVADPHIYQTINKPQDFDLTQPVPKRWEAVILIPQKLEDGIESGMRQQHEVNHDYSIGGPEQAEVEELFASIYSLTDTFLHGEEVGERKLFRAMDKTAELMGRLGISSPTGDSKKRIVETLRRAAGKDRLGRVNPMVSRVLWRAAYLEDVKLELISRLSREKSNKAYWLMGIERSTTRTHLENTRDALEVLLGVGSNIGSPYLTEEQYLNRSSQIPENEIAELKTAFSEIARYNLSPIRVAPYLVTAKFSEAILTGQLPTVTQEIIRNYSEEMLQQLTSMKSLNASFIKKDMTGVRNKSRLVISLINQVLNDPGHTVTTVF